MKHNGKAASSEKIISRVWGFIKRMGKSNMFKSDHQSGDYPIMKQAEITISSNKRCIPKLLRWSPPEEGYLKLNIDGAFRMMEGDANGGCIIRDHTGDYITGAIFKY